MDRTCRSRQWWRSIGTTVVLVALLLLLVAGAETQRTLRNVKMNEKVPAFSVMDPTGKPIGNEAFAGKALVLLFARPEHDRSLEALRIVDRLREQYSESADFSVLAVSTKPGTAEYFKELVAKHGLALGVAMDPERKMYGDFGLIVSPTVLLIDKKGVLRYGITHVPVGYERKLSIHTEQLLGKITQKKHDVLLSGEHPGRSAEQDALRTQLAFAEVLIDKGHLDLAMNTLTQITASSGDSIQTDTLRGRVFLKRGMDADAAKCLDRHAANPDAPGKFKRVYARLQIHRGNMAAAETLLLTALGSSPEKSAVLYELGLLYERMNQPDKALEKYRQSLEGIFGSDF